MTHGVANGVQIQILQLNLCGAGIGRCRTESKSGQGKNDLACQCRYAGVAQTEGLLGVQRCPAPVDGDDGFIVRELEQSVDVIAWFVVVKPVCK